MVNVDQEMFADGHAVATAALDSDTMPEAAMAPHSLTQGSATPLWAILDPELSRESYPFLTTCLSACVSAATTASSNFLCSVVILVEALADTITQLAAHSGAFLVDCAVWDQPWRPHATGQDKEDKLWELSEKLVGQKFEY